MSSVTVVSLNVCSIVRSNRINLLKDFINQTNASIILAQETQTDSTIKISMPGYNIFRGDIKKGWSGTAIFIDNNIPVRNLKITRDKIHSTSIECKFGGNWLRFSSVYLPQNIVSHDDIKNYFTKNPNTFFGADTNARHPFFGDYNTNSYGVWLNDIALTSDLKIFNSISPTCYRANSGSFIDKFMSNSALAPIGNVTSIQNFSDHSAIICQLPLQIPETENYLCMQRLYNKAPLDKINRHIGLNLERQSLPLNNNLSNAECDQIATNLNNIFQKAVSKNTPTIKNGFRTLLSPSVRLLQRASKRIQRKIFNFGPLIPVNILVPLLSKLKLLRIMIVNGARADSGKFFKNIYDTVDSNKRAFNIIKKYTGHKKRSSTPSSLFVNGDKSISIAGSGNMANALAKNFSKESQFNTKLEF